MTRPASPDAHVNFDAPAILRKWPSLNNQRRTEGSGPYLLLDGTLDDCIREFMATLALSPIRDTLIEGFSHFVTSMTASLIGRLGSSTSDYPPLQCRCLTRARASLRNRHQGPSIMGSEDEAEQSPGRPCHQSNGRSKQSCELTSSIVPRGTSFHC